jgi:arsenate reductase-like glutaredoxin family protein
MTTTLHSSKRCKGYRKPLSMSLARFFEPEIRELFRMKVKAIHVIKWISKITPISYLAQALASFAV